MSLIEDPQNSTIRQMHITEVKDLQGSVSSGHWIPNEPYLAAARNGTVKTW
jgi:hypothetical protein